MAEDINTEIKEDKKCCCGNKALKIFLLNILGSFLGCLVALCLYSAATRPQFPPPPMHNGCPIQKMHKEKCQKPHHEFKGQKPEFKDQRSEFREQRPEIKGNKKEIRQEDK